MRKGLSPPFRPRVDPVACDAELYHVMTDCWTEYPEERPGFLLIKQRLRPLIKTRSGNLMDNLINRMEKYATDLETLVQERTFAFMEEKRKSEELLNQMLPKYGCAVHVCKRWFSLIYLCIFDIIQHSFILFLHLYSFNNVEYCRFLQADCGETETRRLH